MQISVRPSARPCRDNFSRVEEQMKLPVKFLDAWDSMTEAQQEEAIHHIAIKLEVERRQKAKESTSLDEDKKPE